MERGKSETATLKDKCAIAGIGWTKYSRNSGTTVLRLAIEACQKAIEDSGLSISEVDGLMTYHMGDSVSPMEVATSLGLAEIRYNLEYWAGGNGACSTVATAALAIMGGMAKNIVVYRALNGRSAHRYGGTGEQLGTSGGDQFLVPYGWVSWPQTLAMLARRHMYEYGTTSRQFGAVAVACRKHACLNDRAVMRKPITIEDHQNSKMVVAPFRLLDICLETDGACAILVTSATSAKSCRHRPIYIMAAAHGGGPFPGNYGKTGGNFLAWQDYTELYAKYISPHLFRMAGVTPQDIDVAELYDCFTAEVITQLEDFGFCKKGEGGSFVEGGRIEVGGALPVNTHGGLLSEGFIHGLNHVVEAVSQLRGDAGARQVKDAELAICSGLGTTMGSAVILRR